MDGEFLVWQHKHFFEHQLHTYFPPLSSINKTTWEKHQLIKCTEPSTWSQLQQAKSCLKLKPTQWNSLNAESQEASTLLSSGARGIDEAWLDEVLQVRLAGHNQALGPTPERRINMVVNNSWQVEAVLAGSKLFPLVHCSCWFKSIPSSTDSCCSSASYCCVLGLGITPKQK